MNDEDFIDLVEKDISGEITGEERRRLQAHLDENGKAREIHRRMLETCEVLNKVGDLEPPAGMKVRIMDSIDPALYSSAARRGRRAPLSDALLRPRLRLACAFALGIAIGLVIYSMMPGAGPGSGRRDAAYLYGTIAGGERVELGEIGSTAFAEAGVEGEIVLLRTGNILVLETEFTAGAGIGLVVEFDPARIRFEGYGAADGLDMRIVASDGSVAAYGAGAGRYVLTLIGPATGPATLGVEVSVSGFTVHRHEFTVDSDN